MPKASIYKQIEAVRVQPGPFMKPSPRLWNPGFLHYKGRLWMAYRFHLGVEHGSRSAQAFVPLDRATFQPSAPSQHLNLPAIFGDEHFEDARLFIFKGQPHISYTHMTGYTPGTDYDCTIRYARLKLNGNRWLIEEEFWPKYGNNHGSGKEKNWAFFEYDGALHVVYCDQPTRKIIRLDGDRVVEEYESEAALWPWGLIRGGTPPIPYGTGKMIALFHSLTLGEPAPNYARYYAAAYVCEAKPPFKLLAVSHKPIMSGSEAEGHGIDPRYPKGWKPFVAFPCGMVPDGKNWLVSLGVNDWQCAIGRITPDQLNLISPDRSDAPVRYFRTVNGSNPAKMITTSGLPTWLQWEIPSPNLRGITPTGYFATQDGREAEVLADAPLCEEIGAEQYRTAGGRMATQPQLGIPMLG